MEQMYIKHCKTLNLIYQFTTGKAVCKVCRSVETKSKSENICVRCNESKHKNEYNKKETVCKKCCDDLLNIFSQKITGPYTIIIHDDRHYKMTIEQGGK